MHLICSNSWFSKTIRTQTTSLSKVMSPFKIYALNFNISHLEQSEKDGDKAKDAQSVNDCEAMEIVDMELKAEASILVKEVNAQHAFRKPCIFPRILLYLTPCRTLSFDFLVTKGGRNDRRGKSSTEG